MFTVVVAGFDIFVRGGIAFLIIAVAIAFRVDRGVGVLSANGSGGGDTSIGAIWAVCVCFAYRGEKVDIGAGGGNERTNNEISIEIVERIAASEGIWWSEMQ
jgi:hypothetical protein